jgi:magnesium chelatase family protein
VLFLDELPEFKRTVLEVMRQPMEERMVTISRARQTVEFPAGFMLVAAMNPCPCGYYNHPKQACSCLPGKVPQYLNRISGPLMDRIDIHIEVVPVPFSELSEMKAGETSQSVRERVMKARKIQEDRFSEGPGIYCNAQMSSRQLSKYGEPGTQGRVLLKGAMEKLNLSARAYDRILKVARTIADLDNKENLMIEHLAEAINYRSLDRDNWGK